MPSNSSMPIFLINLDSRSDRLEKMTSRLGKLSFTRIAAINGKILKKHEIISPNTKYKLAKNEIACILSHRFIWEKIIAENIPYACILEDDVVLSDSFSDFIKNSNWLPDNFNVIKIETNLSRIFLSRRKFQAGDRFLRQLGSMHAGTAGYIVSLKGAVNLLGITQFPVSPLDHLMFEITSINSDFKVLQMCPALCLQENILCRDAPAASDIREERSRMRPKEKIDFIPKLRRETKRPFSQLLSLIRIARENLFIIRYLPFV